MKYALILCFILILSIPILLSSEPETVYIKQYLNPFYRPSMTQNTNYTYAFSINPPSQVSEVKSAIVTFEVFIQPTVVFYAYVNGTPCSTQNYTISTTYATSGLAKVNFDCSNVITKKGNYVFTLRPTLANTGSSTGWIEITYQQDKLTFENLKVYGTEYVGGEYGKVWVQLLDSNKRYISNATCLATIYYPDGSVYEKDAFMDYQDKGIYYFNFFVPMYAGVYPVVAECFYTTTQFSYVASSGAINTGTNVAGDYTRTWTDDGSRWEVQESGGRINVGLNFTNLTQPLGFTNIIWIWNGEWKKEKDDLANDYITIQVYNFTNSSWLSLPNKINYMDGEQTITNTISSANLTTTGLVQNGVMRIRMVDRNLTDAKATKLKTDYFSVRLVGLTGGEYQEVKGSSEIHVSQGKGYYVQTLCGEPDSKENCGIFTNDNEFDQLEGEIEDNITVYSISQIQLDTYFTYETPHTVDCSAVYWVKYLNNETWTDITNQVVYHSSIEKENCLIEIPLSIEPYGIAYYMIKMDNYLKWEVLWTNDLINGMKNEIKEICYSINSTHNYSVPITETTYLGYGDTRFCHRSFDDLWWWDYYYNQSQSVSNVGDYTSYLVLSRFYRRAIYDELSKLRQISIGNVTFNPILNITYNATINATFNITNNATFNITNNITIDTSFMNESISSLNQSIISMNQSIMNYLSNLPYLIWNYINRTLTEFNFKVDLSDNSLSKILSPIETISLNVNSTKEDISFINQTLFANFQKFDDYLISINNTIKDTNSTLSLQISNLHLEIQSLNQEIGNLNSNITQLNSTILNKLYKIQDEISSINETLKQMNITLPVGISSFVWEYPLRNLTYYPPSITASEIWNYSNRTLTEFNFIVNANITNDLEDMKSYLISLNNTIKDTNSTLSYQIQKNYEELERIIDELKTHNSTLLLINSTLSSRIDSINSNLNLINISITNSILNLKSELQNSFESINQSLINLNQSLSLLNQTMNQSIYGLNQSIFLELGTVKDMLLSHNNTLLEVNTSIFSKLHSIQKELSSINDTVKDANSTLSYQISLINDKIENATSDIQSGIQFLNITLSGGIGNITSSIYQLNSTVSAVNSSIMAELEAISSNLLSLNETINASSIDINSTMIAETYLNTYQLIDNLNSHNDKLISINDTIMSKLYRIQDEISSVNYSVISNFDEIGLKVWSYYNRTLSNFTINGTTIENLNALATFRELKYAGGTEYSSGEEGTIAFQFLSIQSGSPVPIKTGKCNTTIWYPNKTSIFLSSEMSYLPDSEGIYYRNFTAPSIEGVYTSEAVCLNETDNIYGYGSSSFHVGNWTNKIFLLPNETSDTIKEFIISYNAEFEPTNYTCISNSTMRVISSHDVIYDGKSYTIERYKDYECEYGCDAGKCKTRTMLNLWIFIIAVSIGLFLSFLVRNNIIRIFGGLILILVGVFTIVSGIELSGNFTKPIGISLSGTSISTTLNNQLTLAIGLAFLGLGMVVIWLSLSRKQ